jgi:hypothetical protein
MVNLLLLKGGYNMYTVVTVNGWEEKTENFTKLSDVFESVVYTVQEFHRAQITVTCDGEVVYFYDGTEDYRYDDWND